jgi:hypothetical protein
MSCRIRFQVSGVRKGWKIDLGIEGFRNSWIRELKKEKLIYAFNS